MPEDFNGSEEPSFEEEAEQACRLIRRETISPLTWFFPVANACTSCILLTGGHPEIMAAYCPRVLERLTGQGPGTEPEPEPEA
ncbi:MAG: hypothetical protein BGO39_28320 [Chloroflexi bacterium 54-19]|nr:MAG: hypothetical protein BGO39_28320 [Chloroflexi bacterium 54-19]